MLSRLKLTRQMPIVEKTTENTESAFHHNKDGDQGNCTEKMRRAQEVIEAPLRCYSGL